MSQKSAELPVHTMTAVKALRTQIDSLQWGVNRLDALKVHEEASVRVDLEVKLEWSKQDVVASEQLRACQRTAEESKQVAADTESQAASAQLGTESQTNPGKEVEYQRELEEALERVTTAEQRVQRLETELGKSESSRSRLEDKLRKKEQKIEYSQSELAIHHLCWC